MSVQLDDNDSALRVLVDGDLCDKQRCGATAYVRVHILDPVEHELIGTLHWCAHHYTEVAMAIWELEVQHRASVIDERRHVGS